MITVNTGINESTICNEINKNVKNRTPIDFYDIIMSNVMDTIGMNSINDAYFLTDYEEDLIESFNAKDLIDFELYLEEKVKTANILEINFGDKEWNSDYRDIFVTVDIDLEKTISEFKASLIDSADNE